MHLLQQLLAEGIDKQKVSKHLYDTCIIPVSHPISDGTITRRISLSSEDTISNLIKVTKFEPEEEYSEHYKKADELPGNIDAKIPERTNRLAQFPNTADQLPLPCAKTPAQEDTLQYFAEMEGDPLKSVQLSQNDIPKENSGNNAIQPTPETIETRWILASICNIDGNLAKPPTLPQTGTKEPEIPERRRHKEEDDDNKPHSPERKRRRLR